MISKEKRKAVIEWAITVLLIGFALYSSPFIQYYHLSPKAAHEQSERTYYYGPSEIVEEVDLGDVRIYLGKYKEWFSANMVLKTAGLFWVPGSNVGGNEVKTGQDLSYSWSGTAINDDLYLMMFYGIVTNPAIVKVELDVQEGTAESTTTLSENVDTHGMFLFHWNELKHKYQWKSIRGLDENGQIIYDGSEGQVP